MINMTESFPLQIFPRKPKLLDRTLDDNRAPLRRPGVYPQNLSIICTALNSNGF